MSRTRVLVADSHSFFCSAIADWLNQQATVTCCGHAGSVPEARRALAELQPDVVLLDLQLREGDGFDFACELTNAYPALRLIAVSAHEEEVYVKQALRAGVRGYVLRAEATEAVLTAIETVLAGELYVSPLLARLLQGRPAEAVSDSTGDLTAATTCLPVPPLGEDERSFRPSGSGVGARQPGSGSPG